MEPLVNFKLLGLAALFSLYMAYSFLKLRRQIHMMQLNGYFISRYLRWCGRHFLDLVNISDFEPFLAMLGVFMRSPGMTLLLLVLSFAKILLSHKTLVTKKRLVFTSRVWRLLIVCLTLLAAFFVMVSLVWIYALGPEHTRLWLVTASLPLSLILMPLWLVIASLILMPLEYAIKRRYFNEGKAIIANFDRLKRIAITGSFGKTTTKYILDTLLNAEFYTLKTPGSYNTPMGITKVIREQLRPIHQVLVVEMSARKPHDIAELCELVRPQYGVITVVGEQHLEFFKTIERVKQTKYELVEALPKDGKAFLNLDDPNSTDLIAKTTKVPVITFSLNNPKANYYLSDISSSAKGSSFKLWINGQQQAETFVTSLLGRANLYDVAAAIAVAGELGLSPAKIAAVLPSADPAPHRLELKNDGAGILVIDDSYNANPVGAQQALEVLATFKDLRKIIVTPGMIELGAKERYYNAEFSKQIAKVCDYVILVGSHGQNLLLDGLNEAQYPLNQCFVAANFYEARDHLSKITQKGDIVLFENDLTDDYES